MRGIRISRIYIISVLMVYFLAMTSAKAEPIAIERWSAVLRAHVDDDGMVNYAALKADSADLDAFLESAAALERSVYEQWSEDQQIAFWCNVYNAYTLRAILDHYPIQASVVGGLFHPKNSIRQISGVWDMLTWRVMGREMTLDAMEHETLRVDFDEPRIHAALVCAAMGCPPLRNEPYDGARLDAQLDDQMKRFLSQPEKFRIDRESNIVYLSSIFEWYGEDFVKSYGGDEAFSDRDPVEGAVLNVVSRYVSEGDRKYLREAAYTVHYSKYDWSLNEQ